MPLRRLLAYLLIFTYLFSPQSGLAQTVAAVAGADKTPVVAGTAALPIIHIAAPNGGGISHNQYQSFNVPASDIVGQSGQTLLNTGTLSAGGDLRLTAGAIANTAAIFIHEGSYGHNGQNPAMQTLAHATLGCATAAANNKECAAGAIGAAGASILNPVLDGWIGGEDGSGWGSDPQWAA